MRKILLIFIICSILLVLTACGSEGSTENDGNTNNAGNTNSGTDAVSDSVDADAAEAGDSQSSDSQSNDSQSSDSQSNDSQSNDTSEGTKNALVVYFSATGNTKGAAEKLAELQNADIYEIVPEQAYTSADLNYSDRSSRSTAEQNDSSSRPAISGGIDNIADYDVIYVGYPIWWGDMPRILYTFFDAYDLSGKTIAPFCTSGGSGICRTPETIADLEPEAEVLDGLHIGDSSLSRAESYLTEWIDSLGSGLSD